MALLAFANVSEARSLQEDTDEGTSAGTDGENTEEGAATECKEGEECPEGDGEAAEEGEEEKEPERAKNEPGGTPWRPH